LSSTASQQISSFDVLWVKSQHDAVKLQCPLYPRKRTFPERAPEQ
jgi:hypothetical protein